jgi:dihydroneopterin aldolase
MHSPSHYTICIKNHTVFLHIGAFDEERKQGQEILLNLKLKLAFHPKNDLLGSVLDYGIAVTSLHGFLRSLGQIRLLETLGQYILDHLFNTFASIEEIELEIEKPHPPIAHFSGQVSLILQKTR